MSEAPPRADAAPDPLAILRSKRFIAVLLLAAVIGVVVSFVSWAFLEFVHYTCDQSQIHAELLRRFR